MKVSPARVVVVTLSLSLLGAICGAILGGLTTLTHLPPGALVPPGVAWPRGLVLRFVLPFVLFGLEFGAFGGSILGAVLTPIVGWIFLRRVPLDRAIRQTALGVAIAITVGALFPL